jgi:glutamine amidotransferase
MCLAIYKPYGKQIKKKYLESGFASNPHGAGFCYPNDAGDEIVIQKGLMSFDAFWAAYEPHQDKACLIHFRWATHGARDGTMTHPFPIMVNGKAIFAVVHNGIIPGLGAHKDKSDTAIFVDSILGPIMNLYCLSKEDAQVETAAIRWLVEGAVGSSNKIVLIDVGGTGIIFNENSGSWHKHCWYSNKDYEIPRTRIQVYGSGSGACGYGDWGGRDLESHADEYWDTDKRKWIKFDSAGVNPAAPPVQTSFADKVNLVELDLDVTWMQTVRYMLKSRKLTFTDDDVDGILLRAESKRALGIDSWDAIKQQVAIFQFAEETKTNKKQLENGVPDYAGSPPTDAAVWND